MAITGISHAIRATSRVGHVSTGSLVEAQEADRARIARELHDSLGQKIALLQAGLDQISRSLPSREQMQLHQLSAHVADIARELHEVAYELHPLRLEILGLAKSIEALCRETARHSGVDISFSGNAGLPPRVGAAESLCLYRVAQEALHNVVKHSKADPARVQLCGVPGALELIVADTGQGFDDSAAPSGLGLTSMRQRVELLNGALTVHTRRGGGTRVRARIPVLGDARTDDWRRPEASRRRRPQSAIGEDASNVRAQYHL
jgi:signal transduction histidine kinase